MQLKRVFIFLAVALAGGLNISGANAAPDTAAAVISAERKAILDALRQEIKQLHGLQVVFVVKQLKIMNGWAWLHTLPQSSDGKNRYEDVAALLRKQDGRWQIMEIPCIEEDNPDCLGDPQFFKQLQHRFKGLPPALLPLTD